VGAVNPFEIWGTYSKGLGKAHEAFEASRRVDNVAGCLGANMVGTFNVSVTRRRYFALVAQMRGKTGFWLREDQLVPVRYHLCRICHTSGAERMAWIVDWRPPVHGTKDKTYKMEVISRYPLDDSFKDGSRLKVLVYDPWDATRIAAWWPKVLKKWFQSFDWGPKRSDDMAVWNAIFKWPMWTNSTVLDVGCNTGWYSFMAAKYGARVSGYDTNADFVKLARTIAGHIEYADVDFGTKDPGGTFDVIMYLSVHHCIDPEYIHLRKTVEQYKKRCKLLFIELLCPPPGHTVGRSFTENAVGGQELLSYTHAVRGHRVVWKVVGDLA